MPGADRQRAVELLGGNDGGEFVRQGDASEGQCPVGAGERGGRPAVCAADGEDELLGAAVLHVSQRGGEVLGAGLLAAAVAEPDGGAGAGGGIGDELEQFCLGGKDLERGGRIRRGALQVEPEQLGGGARSERAAGRDEGEYQLHASKIADCEARSCLQ